MKLRNSAIPRPSISTRPWHFIGSVSGGKLQFEDLAVKYNFAEPKRLDVARSRFDNEAEVHSAIAGSSEFRLPDEADIVGG